MIGSMLVVVAMNGIDVGRYAFETSEVNAAAQAGAQAAYVACDPPHTPATLNCPDLKKAVTSAIQATRLGSKISLKAPIAEAYYCVDEEQELQPVGAADAKPADCTAVENASGVPGLYLQVQVAHEFKPLFPGLTLANTFSPAIVRTSWMRMA